MIQIILAALVFAELLVQKPPAPADSGGISILSDTHGYDFGPYQDMVLNRVRMNWYQAMPEAAWNEKGRVVAVFNVERNGSVTELRITSGSGSETLDRVARDAVAESSPFQRLPSGFDGDHVSFQLVFLYNRRP